MVYFFLGWKDGNLFSVYAMLARPPWQDEAVPTHLGSLMVLGYCLFFRASVKEWLWKERS